MTNNSNPQGWKECKLGKAVEFKNGKSRPSEIENGTIPIYGGNGILGYTDTFNHQGETVIVGRVGAYCGSVFYENKPIWVSDNALYAIPKNGTDAKFLYYLLKNMGLNSQAEGSSHPLLTQTLLNSLDVFITDSLPEQRAIAGVLSSLDDKIDLLHRQNKTLESMAEALWRKMFVEEADVGWKKRRLGDIASVSTGKGLKRIEYNENGLYPVIGANGEIGRTDKYLTNEKLILTGRVGTLGEVFISNKEVWISDNVLIMKPGDKKFFYPIYFLLKNTDFENLNVGSTQPLVTQTDMKNIEIRLPNNDSLEFLGTYCETAFNKTEKNDGQIRTLSRLRDTLLPKLMSGEVKVKV